MTLFHNEKIEQHENAEADPIPSKNNEIMLLNEGHQELNDEYRHQKRNDRAEKKKHNLESRKTKAKLYQL